MKVLTVVGARPQFVKAAAVSRALIEWNQSGKRARIDEVLVHTGQHHDHNMSQSFFDDLSIPAPKHNFEIHGGSHGAMTGRMLEQIERVLLAERPDWVLVYGDTNSTLAGALAAAKLHFPVAHVEAGLRSFNMKMPEEINRILSDRISELLLCPTDAAVANLQREGRTDGVFNVGDVMYDASLFMRDRAEKTSNVLSSLELKSKAFCLATVHRAENTDEPARLTAILEGLNKVAAKMPVVLPIHPRTRKIISAAGMDRLLKAVRLTDPVSYIDMVKLENHAAVIATDSGGVQKEALFYGVPCVTLRDETEWVETVQLGWNRLVSPGRSDIAAAVFEALESRPNEPARCYGDGTASFAILEKLGAR